jgi:hypothetical protein
MKIKLSSKQSAILKSYLRGVLVSALSFLASNELGLDPIVSIAIASIAGPAARALDPKSTDFGKGSN